MSGRHRVAAILAAFALAAPPLAAQTWRTLTRSRQIEGDERLSVEIKFAMGTVRVEPASGGTLYAARLHYDADLFEPVMRYDARSRSLRLGIEGLNRSQKRDWDDTRQRLDVALTPLLPMTLAIEFGAASGELALGGLAIERATIKTGASQTKLAFAAPNPAECERLEILAGAAEFDAEGLANARCRVIDVKGGLGEVVLDFTGDLSVPQTVVASLKLGLGDLRLRVPRGVGVEIDGNRLFASASFPELVRSGSRYVSEGFDAAPVKLRIEIGAALGGIDLEWVENR